MITKKIYINHAIRMGCLVLIGNLVACSSFGLMVANSLASFEGYSVIDDIAYGHYGLNRLSVYTPENKSKSRATIIFFYGGCWGGCETLNKEYYSFVAQALTAKGYNVIIPDYRRHPEVKIDAIMYDATHAVEWVKEHITEYGGDPGNLFLMGHSAGAHIAAMLTFNEKYLAAETYRNIKGFIGLAGPYDFLPFTDEYQKIVFAPEKNYPNTQPVNFVDGSEPPILLLHGNDDDSVKPVNIISLHRTVKRQGGCVESHRYNGLNHTDLLGALSIPLQAQQPVLNDIVDFINYYADGKNSCRN